MKAFTFWSSILNVCGVRYSKDYILMNLKSGAR